MRKSLTRTHRETAIDTEREKKGAAEAAAELVESGMTIGLGTGSTVAHLLPILAARRLDISCVPTSKHTEEEAARLGLRIGDFTSMAMLDLAIDGADQVAPSFWLIKGGGAAHTREKIVAAAAERFIVIVDSSKLVDRLHSPVPLELVNFGVASTLERLGSVTLRDGPLSPDGGVIADWRGDIAEDPAAVARWLAADPGTVDHGLFPPSMVSAVVVGRGASVEWIDKKRTFI